MVGARLQKLLSSKALAVGFLAVAGVGAYWLGSFTGAGSISSGNLQADSRALDFGEVWENSKFALIIPVQNTGPKALEIIDFATSCPCVSLEPTCFTLESGRARDLNVTVDLTKSQGVGPLKIIVAPQLKNNTGSKEGFTVFGVIKRFLTFSESPVHFGELCRAESLAGKTVLVTSAADLADLKADSDKARVVVTIKRLAPRRFEVNIGPGSKLPLGPLESNIVFTAVADNLTVPAKTLRVYGSVCEEVETVPSRIHLGDYAIGARVIKTFSLRSRLGRTFVVEGVKAPAGMTIEPMASSHEFQLIQRISEAGLRASKLLLYIKTDKGRQTELCVDVSYYGQEI